MNSSRLEKFEMKYGYFFPPEYKSFIYKYGGDSQFGSCRFEYADNIINNLVKIPGFMDYHLIPFGDIGNGDYYCFYRYGIKSEDYYIGIWLHETRNFVILSSNFKSFLYKCLLDDYLSTVIPNDELSESDKNAIANESLTRCDILSDEYGYDMNKVKNMKNEFDYHRLMVEYDEGAVQSLCFIGKALIKRKDKRGFDFLNSAVNACNFYTAPYYLIGKALINEGVSSEGVFKKALKTSLLLTGYSYWEEDYLEIPEDVHREIALYIDAFLKSSDDFLYKKIYNGCDPYDCKLRLEAAKQHVSNGRYANAMQEYSNALFCCDDREGMKDILKEALSDARDGGLYHLTGVIEQDIRMIR